MQTLEKRIETIQWDTFPISEGIIVNATEKQELEQIIVNDNFIKNTSCTAINDEVKDSDKMYGGDQMRNNGPVSSNNIEMLLLATKLNKFQYHQTIDRNKNISEAIKYDEIQK